MNVNFLKTFLILLVTVLLLYGCASTQVISKSDESGIVEKLVSAKVVWMHIDSIPIKMSTRRYSVVQNTQSVQKNVSKIWNYFNKYATAKVNEQLTLNNVADDDNVLIEITPVSVETYFGKNEGISQKFIVRTSINDPVTNRELWYVTISVLQDFDDTEQMALNQFVATLITELRNSGWLI